MTWTSELDAYRPGVNKAKLVSCLDTDTINNKKQTNLTKTNKKYLFKKRVNALGRYRPDKVYNANFWPLNSYIDLSDYIWGNQKPVYENDEPMNTRLSILRMRVHPRVGHVAFLCSGTVKLAEPIQRIYIWRYLKCDLNLWARDLDLSCCTPAHGVYQSYLKKSVNA